MPSRLCILLLLCLALPARAADDARIFSELLKKNPGGTVAERIAEFSQHFLGAKYSDYALGEGVKGKYDRNPLYRADAFNCTTIVETVMALALSHDLRTFESTLAHIRYRNGEIAFTNRNHFPVADWIPNNTAAGFLTDITTQVAGPVGTLTARAAIDKKGWYQHLPLTAIQGPPISPQETDELLSELKAEGAQISMQLVSLPYIAIDRVVTRPTLPPEEIARRKGEEEKIEEKFRQPNATSPTPTPAPGSTDVREKQLHDQLVQLREGYVLKEAQVDPAFLERIPSGTIINFVRPRWQIPGTQLLVTHQGFVIRKKDGVYFRHSSRSGGERLKDVTLASYLKLCLLSPSIKGINLQQVNERKK